jgi:adenylyl-sulfate kinase
LTAVVAWMTGRSGAGKSTIADRASARLQTNGRRVTILDGDAVRTRLHRHLGFSPADIRENNRLIAEACLEALPATDAVLVPVISPFRDARANARSILGESMLEVYVRASLEEVTRRDTKGLYRRAAEGLLPGLIGVDPAVPYEAPEAPDLLLDTETQPIEACVDALVAAIEHRRAMLNPR